jgi:hypothetical protein
MRPDAESAGVAVAAKGTVLKSYAREGDWFRVLVEPGRGCTILLGYVGARDVEVLEESGPPPDVWERVAGEFLGAGLSLRLSGGPVLFAGGDFETGIAGMFDRTAGMAESYDAVTEDFDESPIGRGLDLAADIVYRLTRRWGLGVRLEYWKADPDSFIRFHYGSLMKSYTAWTSTRTSVLALGAGVYYERPLGPAWSLAFRGGPALYYADFFSTRDLVHPAGEDALTVDASALGFGAQAGLAFEWRLHRRAALFVEAQGRLARISGFEGEESHLWSLNLQSWREKTSGTVYLEQGEGPPRLIVREEGSPDASGARKAALDLSGFGLAVGFRIRF